MASDSRISWPTGGSWDFGRKLFAAASFPDIFGYCGDVLFPSLVLGDALTLMDSGLVFASHDGPQTRNEKLRSLLSASFSTYPPEARQGFTILHAARGGEGMNSKYFLWSVEWTPDAGWISTALEMPADSALVLAKGSGEASVKEYNQKWCKALGRTSRSVFGSFCESLASNADPKSGGAPQLVGLYRTGLGRYFGVIYEDRKYLLGVPIEEGDCTAVEWRNSLFERCDCHTLKRLQLAQRQPRPRFT
jgi:hypothetical protein